MDKAGKNHLDAQNSPRRRPHNDLRRYCIDIPANIFLLINLKIPVATAIEPYLAYSGFFVASVAASIALAGHDFAHQILEQVGLCRDISPPVVALGGVLTGVAGVLRRTVTPLDARGHSRIVVAVDGHRVVQCEIGKARSVEIKINSDAQMVGAHLHHLSEVRRRGCSHEDVLDVLQRCHHDGSGEVVAARLVSPERFVQHDIVGVSRFRCIDGVIVVIIQDEVVMCVQLHERQLPQRRFVEVAAAAFGDEREVEEAAVASRSVAEELFWHLEVERMVEGSLRADGDVPAVAGEDPQPVVVADFSAFSVHLVVLDVSHHDVVDVVPEVRSTRHIVHGDVSRPHQPDLSPDQ